MASLGAKVLQSRSVEFAAKFNVPLEVNSSFKEGKGTLVTREDEDMEAVAVSGVIGDRNQAKITVVGALDVLAQVILSMTVPEAWNVELKE